MNKLIVFLSVAIGIAACGTSPQPIDYGHSSCDFCKMTIVDERYASQLVTTKGKTFSFDAAECMIQYQRAEANQRHEYAMMLVTDYLSPGELIDATSATYIRSVALPSPMGAYITATSGHETAQVLKDKHNGQLYSWEALNEEFSRLPSVHHSNHEH